jgi:hypothetical protein
MPDFDGKDEQEKARRRYYWIMAHYFDNIDITDPGTAPQPCSAPKSTRLYHEYVHAASRQVSDTSPFFDILFGKLQKNQDNFKYFSWFTSSTITPRHRSVGYDACYVHIALEYYCKGLASWAKKGRCRKDL